MSRAEPDEAALLAEAEAAFVRGDFATVQARTARLSSSLDAELRKKAMALRARVSFDPLALGVWLVSLGFFVLVCLRYLGGGGGG